MIGGMLRRFTAQRAQQSSIGKRFRLGIIKVAFCGAIWGSMGILIG